MELTGTLWPDGRHLTPREVEYLLAYIDSHPGSTYDVEVTR